METLETKVDNVSETNLNRNGNRRGMSSGSKAALRPGKQADTEGSGQASALGPWLQQLADMRHVYERSASADRTPGQRACRKWMRQATAAFMSNKTTLESKALAYRDQEKKRAPAPQWSNGTPGDSWLVRLLGAFEKGQPDPGLNDNTMAVLLRAIIGMDTVEHFIELIFDYGKQFGKTDEEAADFFLTGILLFCDEFPLYLEAATETALAAREAGLDVNVALRDFEARRAEAISQDRYWPFLASITGAEWPPKKSTEGIVEA